jgi:UDPglucose 6-dehydrogenase
MQIGFVGMSHLGLNSSVAAAHRGASVICYDESAQRINDLNKGVTGIQEPDLDRLLKAHQDTLFFTNDILQLSQCSVVYIALDVETDEAGNSNLSPLNKLIKLTDAALAESVILVVLSQIPPGFSRGLKLRDQRQYYYQVETLIFGDAINRAINPERIIIGTDMPEQALASDYSSFLALFDCPLLPMRYESAELCKISINCCLVASVTIANTLAELCETIGADWSEIVPALKTDRRIGQYSYLSPGLGIAGGNLERDLNTVQKFSQAHHTDAAVIDAYLHNSVYRKDWPYRTLKLLFKDKPALRIAIWGLTYKVDTHSLKNSPSMHFIEKIQDDSSLQVSLSCYDPMIARVSIADLTLDMAESALQACKQADVLIVMTPWPEFGKISASLIAEKLNGKIVLDPYAALSQVACEAVNLKYLTLGKS